MTTRRIEPPVLQALASIEWDGNRARMAPLDRKVYVKVNDALESFGGKWDRKAKAHLFDIDARDAVEAAIESGVYNSAADVKQIFGEFETPDALADYLVVMSGPGVTGPILEPSAGSGQLLKAYKRRFGELPKGTAAIEIQQKRRYELLGIVDSVSIVDFLQVETDDRFALILMNPPFARQADVDHVTHAFKLLRPGGTLVAIMSPGWTFRENKKSKEFRELVEENGQYEKLPEDSFRSAGTGVNTVLVTLRK